jgi:hypothetical protein
MIPDWIVGNRFQEIAKFTYAPEIRPDSDYCNFSNTLDLNLLQDGDTIYTQGYSHYKRQLLEIIRGSKRVILISHAVDDSLDASYGIPDNVIKFYAMNVNVVSPCIEALPAGLEIDIRDLGVHKKEKMVAKMQEERNIRNLVYMDHRIWVNPAERLRPYEILQGKSWVTAKTDADAVPYDGYLDNLYNHKFSICPMGNGISTFRPWEALYMGTIPIERRNINNQFFTELPICFINDWDELTEDFLNKEYERIKNTTWKMKMLTFEFWKNKILTTPL